jgi:hypothetical protein
MFRCRFFVATLIVFGVLVLFHHAYAVGPLALAPPMSFPAGNSPTGVAVGDFNSDSIPDLAVADGDVSNGSASVWILLGTGSAACPFGQAISYPALPNLYPASGGPTAIAVGYLDQNGTLDLAVTRGALDKVSILLGNGQGAFIPAGMYDVLPTFGFSPMDVAIADVDVDGKNDIVVAGGDSDVVRVFFGTGGGQFDPVSGLYPCGPFSQPWSVVVQDLDGDNLPDIAAADAGVGGISVLFNAGGKTFDAPQSLPLPGPGMPVSIASGYLDGDANADLAVVLDGASSGYVLLGTGGGAFATPQVFNAGPNPRSLAIVDLDSNGKQDLVISSHDQHTLTLLAGNGTGDFTGITPVTVPGIGDQALKVATGDFDGDTKPDVVVAVLGGVQVLLNTAVLTPAGFFTSSAVPVGSLPLAVAAGDLNHDGKLDLVTANAGSNNASISLGAGNGTFSAAPAVPLGFNPQNILVGYIDNDPNLDFVAPSGSSKFVSVRLGDGNGNFIAPPDLSFGTTGLNPAASLVDLNGDKKLDLAVATSSGVIVRIGNGDGTFGAASLPYPMGGSNPTSAATGHLNPDGHPDLVVSNTGGIAILLGNGAGGFGPATLLPATSPGVPPTSVAIGDFNQDGNQDVAAIDGAALRAWPGDGLGGFGPKASFSAGSQPYALAAGEFNQDGRTDVAVSGVSGLSILLGTGAGALGFGPPTTWPGGSSPRNLAVGDFDRNCKPDVAVANFNGGNVSIFLNRLPDQDGDGIADVIDTAPALFSSNFNDGSTNGVIADRAGRTVAIGKPNAVGLQAAVSGSGNGTARIESSNDAGGPERVQLNENGERANIQVSGGTSQVTAVLALPKIEFEKKFPNTDWQLVTDLYTGDTASAGSPLTASAANTRAILAKIVDPNQGTAGFFMLDPGESADVVINPVGSAEVRVLVGSVTFNIAGQTATLSAGQSRTFLLLSPDAVLANLSQAISNYVAAGQIPAGVAQGLQAKTGAARQALARGNRSAARGVLGGLRSELDTLFRSRQITAAAHDALAGAVDAVLIGL